MSIAKNVIQRILSKLGFRTTEPSYEELNLRGATYQTNLEALVTDRTEQLRQTIQDLERSNDMTLEGLGDALDLKDAETLGHSKRVTAFTIAIARAMGLPGEKIRMIARGAFLHDIGKLAIPDSILRKPGVLTQEEIAIMREHAYRGYQMLRNIPFLAEAAEIVYAHHEQWDGTGYPRGLKGEEIPVLARIVSVVETLDAIMSNQPYRAARPFVAARRRSSAGRDGSSTPRSSRFSSPSPNPSGTISAKKLTSRSTASLIRRRRRRVLRRATTAPRRKC